MTTQLQSLAITRETAANRRQQILDALFMRPPMTRSELAEITGVRLSSICGRVNELMADGRLIVAGVVYDEQTRRHVETVTTA